MRRTGVSKLRRTGVSKYQGCLKNYEALAGLKTETRWRLISVSKASRKLWDTRASQLWDIRVSQKNSGCLKAVSKNMRRMGVSNLRRSGVSWLTGCLEGISKILLPMESSSRLILRCPLVSFRDVLSSQLETSSRIIQRHPPVSFGDILSSHFETSSRII